MEQLLALVPLIAATVVPMLVSSVRSVAGDVIPAKYFPVLLPILGGATAGLATAFGVDSAILAESGYSADSFETVVQGIIAGFAAVGVHQAKQKVVSGTL